MPDLGWASLGWNVFIAILAALGGGFIGGWTAAFRLGSWRQRIESSLASLSTEVERINTRLTSGDRTLGSVPVLVNELKHVAEEMRLTRQQFPQMVSRRECELRHAAAE